MRIQKLEVWNFRGVANATILMGSNVVLIGANGCGKSTIVDALALVLGRDRMVRTLTEHDFHKSTPLAADRIRIVATISGFSGNDPAVNSNWFRDGRAVPKWWNAVNAAVEAERSKQATELCVQIGFAARFDAENLEVESLRYFHDSDVTVDPFVEDVVQLVPSRLISELGFFLVPSARTWDKLISFGSELFSRLIGTLGILPSDEIISARNKVRTEFNFENAPKFKSIVENINIELANMVPSAPKLKFRLTATDCASMLRAIVPHFSSEIADSPAIPSSKQGSGLLSLQTLLLLLEFGKNRRARGENFIMAIEEPELHVSPGMQKRIINRACRESDQIICTSHSARVVGFFPPTNVRVLENIDGRLHTPALLSKPLSSFAGNYERKLFYDFRVELAESLLHPNLMITEGRIDREWLGLLIGITETSESVMSDHDGSSFGAFVGTVASDGSHILDTYRHMRRLRDNITLLIDGDNAGDEYLKQLLKEKDPPRTIVQWPSGQVIEDAIGWILKGDEATCLNFLAKEEHVISVMGDEKLSAESITAKLKTNTRDGGLKTNYLAYHEIAAAFVNSEQCRARAEQLLEDLRNVVTDQKLPEYWKKADESTYMTTIVQVVWH